LHKITKMDSTSRYTAEQIANWFLSKIEYESGDSIAPLKLQKLVYYAQAWHLAIWDEPLFEDSIEAWVHGPVVPVLYYKFKEICADCPIPIDRIDEARNSILTLKEHVIGLLNEVLEIYGEHSGRYLEKLTHCEMPWKKARNGLQPYEKSNTIITHQDMKEFYQKINNEQKASQ